MADLFHPEKGLIDLTRTVQFSEHRQVNPKSPDSNPGLNFFFTQFKNYKCMCVVLIVGSSLLLAV